MTKEFKRLELEGGDDKEEEVFVPVPWKGVAIINFTVFL